MEKKYRYITLINDETAEMTGNLKQYWTVNHSAKSLKGHENAFIEQYI